MIPHVKLPDSLVVYLDGISHTIPQTHIHYHEILASLHSPEDLPALLDVADLMQGDVYYAYVDGSKLYCLYTNHSKDLSWYTSVTSVEDLSNKGTCTQIPSNTPKHIGTFSSANKFVEAYPEYFL